MSQVTPLRLRLLLTALVLTDTTGCAGAVPSGCQIQDHRLLNTKWFFYSCFPVVCPGEKEEREKQVSEM